MEEELEAGNSLIASTRGSERNKGSKRNKYCSIGKITTTVLIIVLVSAVSVLCYDKLKDKFSRNDEPIKLSEDLLTLVVHDNGK